MKVLGELLGRWRSSSGSDSTNKRAAGMRTDAPFAREIAFWRDILMCLPTAAYDHVCYMVSSSIPKTKQI